MSDKNRFLEKIEAIQDTMYVIGGKWKIPIILSIYSGNKRFNDISNSIPKITNRVLSRELKHLEDNLMITRTVVDDYPVRIEYAVTAYCLRVQSVANPMEEWGRNHRKRLQEKSSLLSSQ